MALAMRRGIVARRCQENQHLAILWVKLRSEAREQRNHNMPRAASPTFMFRKGRRSRRIALFQISGFCPLYRVVARSAGGRMPDAALLF